MIKNKIQNHIITLMVFLFIFNVPFIFLPFGTGKIFSILGFLILFVHAILRRRIIFLGNNDIRFFLRYSTLLFTGATIIAILYRTFDFKVSYAYFLFVIEHLLGTLSIVYFVDRFNKLNIDFILKRFISAIFIQAIIVILMLINEPFKFKIYSMLSIGDVLYNMSLRYDGIRGLGLATNTTYELSFVLSIGLIIIVYFINNAKTSKEIFKLAILYMMIMVATLIVARTGWIGVFISIYLMICGKISRTNFVVFSIKKVKFITIIICMSLLGIMALYFFGGEVLLNLQNKVLPFVFEFFINLFSEKSFETVSTNVLKEMYFGVPLKTFLFGDGRYINENGVGYYMGTDGGYMRHMLYSGMFSVILYIFYYKMFNRIKNNLKTLNNEILAFSVNLIGLYYFLVHIKGDLLMGGNMAVKTIVIIYIFSGFQNNKLLKSNQNNNY